MAEPVARLSLKRGNQPEPPDQPHSELEHTKNDYVLKNPKIQTQSGGCTTPLANET